MRRGLFVLAAFGVLVAACGHGGLSAGNLRSYVAAVEPIRLGVNRLLEAADPILDAYRERRLSGPDAAAAMERLERRFAAYTVDIHAIGPSSSTLAAIHRPYAHTYILEDSYLSALVSGLTHGDLSGLPTTQSAQRAAIIEWRTRLGVLARRTGVRLPRDVQRAGRGEIAPTVSGGT